MLEIIIYSLVIGALGGGCIAAGAARMFHAPKVQAMGAFRTLGEMNACNGDPIAHFSFGLGFFFSAAASAVAAGALTGEVLHRIVPNWSAASLLVKNKNVEETVWNPRKMMLAGSVVGAAVVVFLNTMAQLIPEKLSLIAQNVLTPATGWLINPVMPAIFWLAAMDAGKVVGMWGTVLGGVSALVSGNAVPGIVLGILIGKSAEENGYKSKMVQILIGIVVVMFIAIAYFRGFFEKFM
ncbi:uncharacterized protein (TIGR03580 family) [Mobilisporobacter senegalensis]|uniref:Uncharacterized protein (TIGR03580 family) n=1 Tax=Mobilisporobacter senegalensis TaxID=1329262 RepID=A0A3N1XYE1_9FIRM|nr:DUF4311 domain-containing protein [Mobilisporobacter senegalensis]ROR31589.1 uncharacterized protein (TIGR03580 family) [Mobilisporobacter senegalensis]